jgi:hypothetical protein
LLGHAESRRVSFVKFLKHHEASCSCVRLSADPKTNDLFIARRRLCLVHEPRIERADVGHSLDIACDGGHAPKAPKGGLRRSCADSGCQAAAVSIVELAVRPAQMKQRRWIPDRHQRFRLVTLRSLSHIAIGECGARRSMRLCDRAEQRCLDGVALRAFLNDGVRHIEGALSRPRSGFRPRSSTREPGDATAS